MAVVVVAAVALNEVGATPVRDVFRELEQHAIRQALAASGGNITHAAARLGIFRTTLQRKMRKLGLR